MKIGFIHIGNRMLKTVIAVFTCFTIDYLRKGGIPFYAAIAAVICMQKDYQNTLKAGLDREIATLAGGALGIATLYVEQYVYCPTAPLVRYLILSVLLIPLINVSLLLKRQRACALSCVVFFCITIMHDKEGNPYTFALNRIVDTSIGILIALIVNQLPRLKERLPKSHH